MLGNNINGVLHWNQLFTKYEPSIRSSFEFHDKFTESANKKIGKIKAIALNSHSKRISALVKKRKKTKVPKNLPELVYVGVHVR